MDDDMSAHHTFAELFGDVPADMLDDDSLWISEIDAVYVDAHWSGRLEEGF